VIVGIFLLTAPGITLLFLIQVLGFFWLISGILGIVSIFIDSSLWGWKLFSGVLGIIAGIVVLQHPLWSTLLVPAVLVIFLGIQAIISGGASLVLAFQGGGWGMGILGVLNIVLGLVLLINPWIGVAVLPFILGALGLVGGIAGIVGPSRYAEARRHQQPGEQRGQRKPYPGKPYPGATYNLC
jgi:uncharacterized membrane protein HdeD (DUF308 family)